jgi:hypothetical protein
MNKFILFAILGIYSANSLYADQCSHQCYNDMHKENSKCGFAYLNAHGKMSDDERLKMKNQCSSNAREQEQKCYENCREKR